MVNLGLSKEQAQRIVRFLTSDAEFTQIEAWLDAKNFSEWCAANGGYSDEVRAELYKLAEMEAV